MNTKELFYSLSKVVDTIIPSIAEIAMSDNKVKTAIKHFKYYINLLSY